MVGLRQEGRGQLLLGVVESPAEVLVSGVQLIPGEQQGWLDSAEGVEAVAEGCSGSNSLTCCQVEPLVTGTPTTGSAHWLSGGKRALGCEPPSSQGSCQGEGEEGSGKSKVKIRTRTRILTHQLQ